jgi:putative selenium metabolism hydrolase
MESELRSLTEELCRSFVQVHSPSGQEGELAELVEATCRRLGFDRVWRDDFGSVIAQLGSGARPRVLFDAHLDVVEAAEREKWDYDPFGAELTEDRIYGRGTSDMEGSLVAMIAASSVMSEELAGTKGTLYISGSVLEEVFEGVALGKVLDAIEPDVMVIGAATQLDLNIGQRGRAELVVETIGKPAHSSSPEVGINAVYKMMSAVEAVQELPVPSHPVLGRGIMELTDIISTPYPGASVVPESCRVTYDRRLLVGETEESVLGPIRQALSELGKQDPEFQAHTSCVVGEETTYTGETIRARRFFPGWLFERQAGFVQAGLKALQKAGISAELSHYSFCTNGSQSAGIREIPTLGFGPSEERLAHVANEYVERRQLYSAARGYGALARTLTAVQ